MTPQYERGLNQFGHRGNGPSRCRSTFCSRFPQLQLLRCTILGESNEVDVLDLEAFNDWPFPGQTASQQVLGFPHLITN
jgi:hypothetical protein